MPEKKLNRRGFMLIISSPSGAGKTTLSRLLMQNDKNIMMSISCTTRSPRPLEKHGKDYFFIDETTFKENIKKKLFLEHAKVFGNYYGTPKSFVEHNISKGHDILFDIDWQGTKQITKATREDVVSVFILPPSMKELERRLKDRDQDSDEVIKERMSRAADEISHWNTYDYVIVNESLDASLQKILYILQAERLKRSRQQGLNGFVQKLIKSKT